MAVIKGQNLRLYVGGAPIAGALTCTVHVNTVLDTSTSKDTDGAWESYDFMGLDWDASTDMLLTDQSLGTRCVLDTKGTVDGANIYGETKPISLKKGETICVNTRGNNVYIAKITSSTNSSVTTPTDKNFVFTASVAGSYIIVSSEPCTVYKRINGDPAVQLADLEPGDEVDVKFSTTTGEMNRKPVTKVFSGKAIISDISIRADKQANAQASITLTGNGEITLTTD